MTDDIVTRLRAVPTRGNGMCCGSNSTVPNPYYNRCQEAADEIERLRTMCEQFASCAKSFGTKWGSDVVEFRINEKKFRKTWEKYKGGAW